MRLGAAPFELAHDLDKIVGRAEDPHAVNMAANLGGVIVHGAWNGAATLPFIFPDDPQMATNSWVALGLVLVACLLLVRELLRRGLAYDEPQP